VSSLNSAYYFINSSILNPNALAIFAITKTDGFFNNSVFNLILSKIEINKTLFWYSALWDKPVLPVGRDKNFTPLIYKFAVILRRKSAGVFF